MQAFNEDGVPNLAIAALSYKLEDMTRELLRQMVAEGYTAVDIRATTGYLAGCVQIADSEAIFHLCDKRRREKIANSDYNLNDEEASLLHVDYIRNKIVVIKQYRERTGLGLKESKDAIEAWYDKNKGN